ncbi:unnamed protein product [Vicia faba]|uniref:Uncharacterized protein n=1 Tax=Vicia faba TaxID=3906 RepID=A0AAV0ZD16_VICFA|nr:unnamed protein product [Vicia faba]
MTLVELLDESNMVPVSAYENSEVEISGIQHDFRLVTSGNLFVCCVRSKNDGHMFLREANKREVVIVKLTLITFTSLWKTISYKNLTSIEIEGISYAYDEGGLSAAESLEIYKETFWRVESESLFELLQKLPASETPPSCVIFYVFLLWTLDTHEKFIELALSKSEHLLHGLPKLALGDLPTFLYKYGSYPGYFDIVVNQFDNIDLANGGEKPPIWQDFVGIIVLLVINSTIISS